MNQPALAQDHDPVAFIQPELDRAAREWSAPSANHPRRFTVFAEDWRVDNHCGLVAKICAALSERLPGCALSLSRDHMKNRLAITATQQ